VTLSKAAKQGLEDRISDIVPKPAMKNTIALSNPFTERRGEWSKRRIQHYIWRSAVAWWPLAVPSRVQPCLSHVQSTCPEAVSIAYFGVTNLTLNFTQRGIVLVSLVL